MKISKIELENQAKKITDNLLACVGLKNAKKVAAMVKKSLAAEYQRRKKLDENKG